MNSKRSIDVVCGVIVLDEKGEVLLIKRGQQARTAQGNWGRITGEVEFGETAAEAAVREAREETGITIEILNPAPHHVAEYIDPDKGRHCIFFEYLGKCVGGETQNAEPDKHDEVRWFPLSALPENLSFSTKKALEKITGTP